MSTTASRSPTPPRSDPDAAKAAISIALGLRTLAERRGFIDEDELRLIEQARAWGWSWADIAAAYAPSPVTSRPWSVEGARRRWIALNAKLGKGKA